MVLQNILAGTGGSLAVVNCGIVYLMDTSNPTSPPDAASKSTRIICYGILVLMFGMSVWAWNAIPNDQMMAVHWNVFGQPDGYAPKTVALLILPTIMALVCPAVWWRLAKEQHAENLQKSMPVMNASMIGAFLVILEAHAVIILSAMGYQLPLTQMVLGSIGLLFVVIGGLMAAGKTARNTSVGIRTPWTLKDDVVWSKTNKVGGVIMAFAGLVTIGGALTNPIAGVVGIIGLVVVLPLTTLGLSYHWSKKSAGS